MDETIRVRKRGVITLPAELRQKYGMKVGDTFQLIDLEGIFVLVPRVAVAPELARRIERTRREAGLSIQELLEDLREQRGRYYQDRHGQDVSG